MIIREIAIAFVTDYYYLVVTLKKQDPSSNGKGNL